MAGKHVADLKLKDRDTIGDEILAFYGLKPPIYAVYRTKQRVMMHFADSDKRAAEQRNALARLNPLRGEINGLVDGWRLSSNFGLRCRAERYDRRVGDALVVAFEGDIDGAERILQIVKQDILDDRIGRGRVEYLLAALATGLAGLLLIAAFTAWRDYGEGLDLWRAAAAGAAGAFFSISLAIRGRTVLPNLERQANLIDAALRMVIGMIAAAVLMALSRVEAVDIRLGDRNIDDPQLGWLIVLIIGFIAGFSERFVPDLLGRATGSTEARSGTTTVSTSATAEQSTEQAEQQGPGAGAAEPDTEAAATEAEAATDPLPEEAATDGCVENVELPDEQATQDVDLPPAAGGVERTDTPVGRS